MLLHDLFERANPMSNKNFRQWFGNSMVVDHNGRPLICYHGTKQNFDRFDASKHGSETDFGWFGQGFYFTPDPLQASHYAQMSGGSPDLKPQGNVMPVYLKAVDPFITDQSTITQSFVDEIRADGHDSIFFVAYKHRNLLPKEIIVFSPNQIKSVFNRKFSSDSEGLSEST